MELKLNRMVLGRKRSLGGTRRRYMLAKTSKYTPTKLSAAAKKMLKEME